LSETVDIRLSTGATHSARFPLLSPHGLIRRGKTNAIVDRVVDGGYYENFGATTALELVRALRVFGLKPFVVVVNNEPLVAQMDCVREAETLPLSVAPTTVFFSTLSSQCPPRYRDRPHLARSRSTLCGCRSRKLCLHHRQSGSSQS
jgi:hypothetical protein